MEHQGYGGNYHLVKWKMYIPYHVGIHSYLYTACQQDRILRIKGKIFSTCDVPLRKRLSEQLSSKAHFKENFRDCLGH